MKNCLIPISPKYQEITYTQCPENINVFTCSHTNLYEVSVKFFDNSIITTLPTRTEDGLVYNIVVEKSWRWGVELKTAYEFGLIEEIKFFN